MSRLEEPVKGIQTLKTTDLRPSIMESTRKVLHRPIRRSKRIATDRLGIDEKIIDLDSSSLEGCGVSSVTDIRVTGGRDSLVGQWPWMALIQIFREDNKLGQCGGALISDRHIVTAAHCFDKLIPGHNNVEDNYVEVILGLHSRRSPESHSVRFGDSLVIFLHEDYNNVTLENDIALIQLNKEVEFNKYIKPICLPSFKQSRLLRGTFHIAGWGRNSSRDRDQIPDVLQYASLPAANLDSCKKIFQESSKRVTEHHICAGGKGTDSCSGDSGGPLMYQVEANRWAVTGIVSWGPNSCAGDAPGVYLAVGSYINWINEKRNSREESGDAENYVFKMLLRMARLENQFSGLKREVSANISKATTELKKQLVVISDTLSTAASELESTTQSVVKMLPKLEEVNDLLESHKKPDCYRNEMPRSCQDLRCLGYKLNGFYMIRRINDAKIETVYCDFSKPVAFSGFERRIGYIHHKSSPVYFYVQRNSPFEKDTSVVPFEFDRLNVGGAMNSTSGKFTAPVNGIYHFAFSGIKNEKGRIFVALRVNGNIMGWSFSGRHDTFATLTLHSTLRLRTGDVVDLTTDFYDGGILFDDSGHRTHFSGWLLEEDFSF